MTHTDVLGERHEDGAEQDLEDGVVEAQVEGADADGDGLGQRGELLVELHVADVERQAVDDVADDDHALDLGALVALYDLHEEVEEHAQVIFRVLVLPKGDAVPDDDAAGLVSAAGEGLLAAGVQGLAVVVGHVEEGDVARDALLPEELHLELEVGDHALRGLPDVELLRAQEHDSEFRVLDVPRRDEEREVVRLLRAHLDQLGLEGLQGGGDELRRLVHDVDDGPVDLAVDLLPLLERELLEVPYYLQLALGHLPGGCLFGSHVGPPLLLGRRAAAVGALGGEGGLRRLLRVLAALVRQHGREGADVGVARRAVHVVAAGAVRAAVVAVLAVVAAGVAAIVAVVAARVASVAVVAAGGVPVAPVAVAVAVVLGRVAGVAAAAAAAAAVAVAAAGAGGDAGGSWRRRLEAAVARGQRLAGQGEVAAVLVVVVVGMAGRGGGRRSRRRRREALLLGLLER
mmetsp:Transcript_5830/g.17401  ORF Transcript_5830/g.17401 Transcript_5830/m.17401 type:complete len:459 (+) Transcript_5830:893-2269(+)